LETAVTASWRETISLDDLWEGDMIAVTVEGEAVLLVNVDGQVYAYSNRCPHQASGLDEGDLDGEKLTCVKHMWEFDVTTGCGINPATSRLRSYPCMVNDDGTICVDVSR
jgi:toluene monooxygenase system ferredoxin subunit